MKSGIIIFVIFILNLQDKLINGEYRNSFIREKRQNQAPPGPPAPPGQSVTPPVSPPGQSVTPPVSPPGQSVTPPVSPPGQSVTPPVSGSQSQDGGEREEDYGLKGSTGSEVVKNEIWTYATEVALKVLYPNKTNSTQTRFKTPAFEILQLSKQIMTKGCPNHYVPPEHWDMAVGSFIRMQQRSFKFRESFIDFQELNRINLTLSTCLKEIEEIPFVAPNETCIDGEKVVEFEPGQLWEFGEIIPMVVPDSLGGRKNEPIIESVWKIFLYVHSACYKYFKEGKLNDHNRYTTLLTPLFTNDAWDVWMKDENGKPYELKKDVYAGLLGDALRLMENVDYCAFYPRLAENEYPWELLRPNSKQPALI